MRRSALLFTLALLSAQWGCRSCTLDPAPGPGPGPGPEPAAQAVRVTAVNLDEASVGPPGEAAPARDCKGGPARLTLSGEAPQGLNLETKVLPEGALALANPQVRAGIREHEIRLVGRDPGPATIWFKTPGQACTLGEDCPKLAVTVLVRGGCLGCTRPAEPEPPTSPILCQRDTFYAEAAPDSPTPCAGFGEALRKALTDGVAGHRRLNDAVCAWGAPECFWACDGSAPALAAGYQAEVELSPVLPEDDPAGHRRFWRIRYLIKDPTGKVRALSVPEADTCDAVDRLQAALTDTLAQLAAVCPGGTEPAALSCSPGALRFKAGLECPTRPSQIAAQATDAEKQWHLARLGDGDALATALPTGGATPRIYLLDTGLHPSLRDGQTTIETFGEARFEDPAGGARMGHGAAMAHLIRSLAPNAPLTSVRLFGPEGVSSTADLARALHHVSLAVRRQPDQAALINLSLGWPAEFSLPMVIEGRRRRWRDGQWQEAACAALDDGVGEAVRYTLSRLARIDQSGRGRVTVLAAAGNLPPDLDPSARIERLRGRDCKIPAPLSPELMASALVRERLGAGQDPNQVGPFNLAGFDELLRALNQPPEERRAVLTDTIARLPDERRAGLTRIIQEGLGLEAGWCTPDREPRPRAPRPFLPAAWGMPGEDSGGILGLVSLKQGAGPAVISRRPGPGCAETALTLPIGAHDDRDQLVYAAAQPTALALPGLAVFAPQPDLPVLSASAVPGCTGYASSPAEAPRPISGTSVATALATGLAAQLQAAVPARLAQGLGAPGARPGLDQPGLLRLLLATGQALPDPHPAVRRPSLCKLRRALEACGAAPDPSACLAGVDFSGCGGPPQAPAGDPAYPGCQVAQTRDPAPRDPALDCQTGLGCLTGFEAGTLGPQPADPTCDACPVSIDLSGGAALGTAVLELGAGFPFATHRLERPRLLVVPPVSCSACVKKEFDLGLDGQSFFPGWIGKVTDIKLSQVGSSDPAIWKQTSAYLVVDQVGLWDGKRRTAIEPVPLKVLP